MVDDLNRPGDGGLLILEMNNYKNDILAGIGCGLGFKLSKGEIILGYKSHGIASDIIGITIKKYF